MTKNNMVNCILLLVYCIPYAFLAAYGDDEYGTMLFYGVLLFGTAALSWLCKREDRSLVAVTGNLLSCVISCLCANSLWKGQDWAFKPFGVIGWMIALSLFTWMIQYLIWNWKRDRDPAQSLLVAVCAVSVGLISVVVLILFISARSFGAI